MKKKQKKKNRTYFASIGYLLDKLMVLLKMILNLDMKMFIRFEEEILSSPNHTIIYMEII